MFPPSGDKSRRTPSAPESQPGCSQLCSAGSPLLKSRNTFFFYMVFINTWMLMINTVGVSAKTWNSHCNQMSNYHFACRGEFQQCRCFSEFSRSWTEPILITLCNSLLLLILFYVFYMCVVNNRVMESQGDIKAVFNLWEMMGRVCATFIFFPSKQMTPLVEETFRVGWL